MFALILASIAVAEGLTWEPLVTAGEDAEFDTRHGLSLQLSPAWTQPTFGEGGQALAGAGGGPGLSAGILYAPVIDDEFLDHVSLGAVGLRYRLNRFGTEGTQVEAIELGIGAPGLLAVRIAPRWAFTPLTWEFDMGGTIASGLPGGLDPADPLAIAGTTPHLGSSLALGTRIDTPLRLGVGYQFRLATFDSEFHADRYFASRGILLGGVLVGMFGSGLILAAADADEEEAAWVNLGVQATLVTTYAILNANSYNWPWDDPQPVSFGSHELFLAYSLPFGRHVND